MVLECLGGARACCEECRVRIGRHCLPGMMARKQTLIEKVGSRPMSAMVAISPAGMGSLDKTPDRDDYPPGEAGNAAFDADWAKYTDEHCSRRAGQMRSEDQHELKERIVIWMEKINEKIRNLNSGREPRAGGAKL